MGSIDIIFRFIAPTLLGIFGGYLYNKKLQNKENRYVYLTSQLDRFYGPIYSLILSYETNREQSQTKNDFIIHDLQDEISSNDHDDIMCFLYAKKAHLKTEGIYALTISNISLVNREDINVIKNFWKMFDYHSVAFGSYEYPGVFSLYLENTKLPDDFVKHMKNSYTELIEKIEIHRN